MNKRSFSLAPARSASGLSSAQQECPCIIPGASVIFLAKNQTDELRLVAEMVNAAVRLNASATQAQDEYNRRYTELTGCYESMAAELERLQAERRRMEQKDKSIRLFMRALKKQPVALDKWDDTIWIMMVENATVHRDGSIPSASTMERRSGSGRKPPAFSLLPRKR